MADTLGVLLFSERRPGMTLFSIWEVEKKHISCLQDVDCIAFNTIIGQSVIGDIVLPECA